ncbi:MerR family transcriptional regulator [Micromonospora siamensis]|uniref:DNA-binding transcriptional regulator, MerR family n=1 Tax=Micromonospora siamensis TaxID=299152 RepID=A0A1C5JKZ7_9ACTN|nr:MerR family transcriptional regulator [Micromonospora siamensis]SCG71188.1 DNA-binding transcriptional regulator, MerR family [Micromonospora siamensis]
MAPLHLTTGEFAAQSTLSLKALRLYETRGLLVPARVDPRTGVRGYHPAQLDRARRIVLLRAVGMPLTEIAEVLALDGAAAAEAVGRFGRRTAAEHEVRRSLTGYVKRLFDGGSAPDYPVLVREVAERVVAHVSGQATASELPGLLDRMTGTLFAHLRSVGVPLTGPLFVVYAGQLDEETRGPVELCAPVERVVPPAGQVGVRLDSAHREAYTQVTRGRAGYPAILRAHDVVRGWLTDNGMELASPPREVYFENWHRAEPDEYAAEVALPIRPRS